MNENKKIDYKILYEQAWNQYNIYLQGYSVRNNKFNTIGAVSSIFILVLTTAASAWSKLFYFPTLLLLIPFVIALENLQYKKIDIPWFSKEKLVNQIRRGEPEFFKHQIDDIFLAANTLLEYKVYAEKRIDVSVMIITISIIVSFIIILCLSKLPLIWKL